MSTEREANCMKLLYELRTFYKKEKFSAIMLFLIAFASQFFVAYFWGTYRDCVAQVDNLNKYLDKNTAVGVTFNINNYDNIPEIKEKLLILESVEAVIAPESFFLKTGSETEILLYSQEMWRYAPVTESSTFYTYSNNGKSLPECILFGNVYETYNVGDVIDLPLAQETIKCIVSETVREEADYLSLNMSSTKLSAYELFENKGMVFIKEDENVNKHIRQNTSLNFVIVYKEDAEAKDKEQIKDLLNDFSYSLVSYEEIYDNTKQVAENLLQEKIPAPLFFSIIGMFSCFSISLVFIMRKMQEITIKCLVGCSRLRSVLTSIVFVAIPGIASLVLNFVIWYFYPVLSDLNIISIGSFLINESLYVFLLIEYILILMFEIIAILLTYKGKTLVKLLKDFEKR